MHRNRVRVIKSFDLEPGRILAGKYQVLSRLGNGYEGEVYKVRECGTKIERAAKLFYPHRNVNNKASNFYARKLHKLRDCPILIQYHNEETIQFKRVPVKLLISEYVEGELLTDYLQRQPRRSLDAFTAIHLLHALVVGVECIHQRREYHGDIHSHNVIICRHGLSFEMKLIDFFERPGLLKQKMDDDICDLIRIFYDAIGGQKHYSKQPEEVKYICCGLKRTLIVTKFGKIRRLRQHLETIEWA